MINDIAIKNELKRQFYDFSLVGLVSSPQSLRTSNIHYSG